ncbi:MAG TPA: hypothetical protein VKS03_06400 [Thermoanaerobaculia bacterium]|nr:hypothetical protein [Thermoanaerobaculia bacterium]
MLSSRVLMFLTAGLLTGAGALAQITPAEGYTPPNDDPSVKVGGTIFLDYTWQDSPEVRDADGNLVHSNAFNVGRAYVNVTGQLHHLLSFRITPDITRETGSGSSLSGSYTVRLKYGYAQFNMDDWLPKGTWVRLGLQQTPYVDFNEGVYRYRFQGPIFVDREGFLTSSDLGLTSRLAFPSNYGDVHLGVYNGEGYTRSEANDQKAFQVRATIRPAPTVPVLRGLRLTGFYDADHYVRDAKRQRAVAFLSFEHPWVNVGVDYLDAKDQTLTTTREIEAEGWSAWVTPRTPIGIEGLFRYDELKPDKEQDSDRRKKRTIAGVAYWFTFFKPGVTAALLADYENVKYDRFSPARATEKRYALHMLLNF